MKLSQRRDGSGPVMQTDRRATETDLTRFHRKVPDLAEGAGLNPAPRTHSPEVKWKLVGDNRLA